MSLGNTYKVGEDSRAMLRPTFTGYSNFFSFLYIFARLTFTHGGPSEQLYVSETIFSDGGTYINDTTAL